MGRVQRPACVDIVIAAAYLRPHVLKFIIGALRSIVTAAFIPEIGKWGLVNARLQAPRQAMIRERFQFAEVTPCSIIQHHLPKGIQDNEALPPYPELRETVRKEIAHSYDI